MAGVCLEHWRGSHKCEPANTILLRHILYVQVLYEGCTSVWLARPEFVLALRQEEQKTWLTTRVVGRSELVKLVSEVVSALISLTSSMVGSMIEGRWR